MTVYNIGEIKKNVIVYALLPENSISHVRW